MDRFSGQKLGIEAVSWPDFLFWKICQSQAQTSHFGGFLSIMKKQKRCAAQFGAGCINFQLEISDFGLVREVFVILGEL